MQPSSSETQTAQGSAALGSGPCQWPAAWGPLTDTHWGFVVLGFELAHSIEAPNAALAWFRKPRIELS